jgi:hypothetical protein
MHACAAARADRAPARSVLSIVPRHIQLAIRNDEELSKLLGKGALPLGPLLNACTPGLFAAASLPASLPASSRHAHGSDAPVRPSIGAVTIAAGGVLPNIHSVLLPKAAAEGKKGKQSGSASQAF